MRANNLTLLTDLYELTMMQGYFKNPTDQTVVFDMFYRDNPCGGGFAICAGLEQVIEYIENLRFTDADIEYLRGLSIFEEDFLEYLRSFHFTGDIYAIPEGTVIFPREPTVKVVAPIMEAQLVETAILNIMNHQSLIATKAARVCYAAKGDGIMEFGLRRAQGPDAGMFASGYLFSSYEHMTSVLNGDIGLNKIRPQIEETLNIKPLSSFYLGSRVINTREKEINSYDDMNGLLLRMPNSEAWLFLGEALGANPTPLSFSELYTALQTGAVDAQDNPLPSIESAKFYEVTKYIAITNHVVDSIMPCINGDTWNSMTEAQQEAVTEAMEYARDVNDTARLDREAELIKFFEEKGLTVTYPDINEFKEKVQAKYMENEDMIKDWDMDLYNEIQAMADTTTAEE